MQKITADDGILIERFQQGQRGAFDELVRRHQDQAYRYAFRLTKDADQAADVVAEAFVRVYKSIDGFKGDSSFTTWLYRIETNCFLDIRKKASNRLAVRFDDVAVKEGGSGLFDIADGSQSAHELIEKKERLSTIETGMKSLSESQRSILLMFHAESMTYEDIAIAIRRPIGTVKSRINRARLTLQRALQPARHLFLPAEVNLKEAVRA